MYKKIVKPFFDRFFAGIALIVLLPALLLFALLIKIESKGPIFFLQERLGKNAKIFKIYKFRTMTHVIRKEHKELFGKSAGVTNVGYFLRKFKIDELPQLLNVLIGDMSFVGPRPGLPEQLSDYSVIAKERLKVKPGMTGYAQINGNIFLDWEQRWIYDKKYVEEINFFLDVRILFKTVLVVILGEKYFLRNA